jgi:predicted phosphodiesterase
MRYLVLTDIHANLEALQSCLNDARSRGYDQTLVLGDIVGYGADPNAVVALVQELRPAAIVRGNHDKVACGLYAPAGFRAVARAAAEWTLAVLEPENRSWLAALPEGPKVVNDLLEICHGSPRDEDEYILDELDAQFALRASKRPLCFFGHTHYRVVYELASHTVRSNVPPPDAEAVDLRNGVKYLVNPGAVGQPRDGDPRAAYAIADTTRRQVQLVRVDYPMQITQEKIGAAGLPDALAKRLALGR